MNEEFYSFNMRFVDKSVLDKLDELAKQKNVSRTQLIQDIVKLYTTLKDQFILSLIPPLVRELVREIIKELLSTMIDTIKDMSISTIELRRVTEKLDTFLSPEFKKVEYDQMKIDEILHLVDLSEKEEND